MTTRVAVVDYGAGNLDSVVRALRECGADAQLASSSVDVVRAAGIVLPGVGSFATGMARLRERRLADVIQDAIADGVPFMGICLGMQLLAETGDEGAESPGLGVLPGRVEHIGRGGNLRVPHIGWNDLDISAPSHLFDGVPQHANVYFAHSYHFRCSDPSLVTSTVDYGQPMVASVQRERVFGVQFHPEKSQRVGLRILRNFVESLF